MAFHEDDIHQKQEIKRVGTFATKLKGLLISFTTSIGSCKVAFRFVITDS